MSEFVTNMFQYDVTVGITRSEVIFLFLVHCFQLLLSGVNQSPGGAGQASFESQCQGKG